MSKASRRRVWTWVWGVGLCGCAVNGASQPPMELPRIASLNPSLPTVPTFVQAPGLAAGARGVAWGGTPSERAERLAVSGSSFRAPAQAVEGFAVAIEGECPWWEAHPVGTEWVLSRSASVDPRFDAEAQELLREPFEGTAMLGLQAGKVRPMPTLDGNVLRSVSGDSLEDLTVWMWRATRAETTSTWYRRRGEQWLSLPDDTVALLPMGDRRLLALRGSGFSGLQERARAKWVGDAGPAIPAAVLRGVSGEQLAGAALGDDEALVYGTTAAGRAVLRRWRLGAPVRTEVLPPDLPAAMTQPPLVVQRDEVYLVFGTHVVASSPAGWRVLAELPADAQQLRKVAPGRLLAVTDSPERGVPGVALFELNDGGALRRVALPEPMEQIALGVDGSVWAVSQTGVLHRRDGEAWRVQPLPKPVFHPEATAQVTQVAVTARDNVVVSLGYELNTVLAGNEERRHWSMVVSNQKVTETLRCHAGAVPKPGEPTLRGVRSWAPPAQPECSEAFVTVDAASLRQATSSLSVPWQPVQEEVRQLPEFAELDLQPLGAPEEGFYGAAVNSFAAGQRLREALEGAEPQLEVEVVCGRPPPAAVAAR